MIGPLTLRAQDADGPLGALVLAPLARDETKAYTSWEILDSQGRILGRLAQVADGEYPWGLISLALNTLYSVKRNEPGSRKWLKADGRCNALTVKSGKRCRLTAMPGKFYCRGHDSLRIERDSDDQKV